MAEYDQGTGALIREYVWLDWEPLAVIEGGTIFYVRADHIGRPVLATNASGAKVWTMSFDPFGTLIASTGNPIAARFPGQWFQAESGLHQNWLRDYDPTTGRYIQPDPLGLIDGSSVYGYAGQNPGRWTDPRGQEKESKWPGPNKKKEIACGPYLIVCETDPVKGRHCHWGTAAERGRGKTSGTPNCVRPDGTACEGSAPPPNRVKECLEREGLCEFDEPKPFSIPAVPPLIFPLIPKLRFGGGGRPSVDMPGIWLN